MAAKSERGCSAAAGDTSFAAVVSLSLSLSLSLLAVDGP